MIVLELQQVEIDHCLSCRGIWLDAGELELLLDGTGKSLEFLASFSPCHDSTEKPRRCPICSKKMEKIRYGETSPVVIDRCIKQHGLWFDHGELDTIIRLSSDGEGPVGKLLKDMFGQAQSV